MQRSCAECFDGSKVFEDEELKLQLGIFIFARLAETEVIFNSRLYWFSFENSAAILHLRLKKFQKITQENKTLGIAR